MTVTGMANLAVKVADLDAACDVLPRRRRRGPRPDGVGRRRAGRRVPRPGDDHAVHPGDLRGRGRRCPTEGFLHPALFTDDLDAELDGHTVVWGPEIVEGAFGRRRIAFVDAPGGIRLEFMEQLAPARRSSVSDARELHAVRPSGARRVRRPRPDLRPQRARVPRQRRRRGRRAGGPGRGAPRAAPGRLARRGDVRDRWRSSRRAASRSTRSRRSCRSRCTRTA